MARNKKQDTMRSWVNNDTSQPGNMPARSMRKPAPSLNIGTAGRYPDSIDDSVRQINETQEKLNKELPKDQGL